MNSHRELSDQLDYYLAEMSLRIETEGHFERWIFLWQGSISSVLVNRKLSSAQLLSLHEAETAEKILTFVNYKLGKGNALNEDEED